MENLGIVVITVLLLLGGVSMIVIGFGSLKGGKDGKGKNR